MSKIYIGTSGWAHADWKEVFYPSDVKVGNKLEYYRQFFNTVEINSTFYHNPPYQTWKNWALQTGPDFVFGIKGSRFISHILKLDNSLEPIKSLWQGVRLLGGKAGPVFLQLPNQFELNQYRLEKFVQNLPTKLKIALEFGHPSWYQNQVFSILEEKNVGLVLNKDTLKQGIAPITANFVYVRLPGTDGDGEGKIEEGDLAVWAKSITGWLERGLDVFVYFTNHQQARAIQDAKELKNLLNC